MDIKFLKNPIRFWYLALFALAMVSFLLFLERQNSSAVKERQLSLNEVVFFLKDILAETEHRTKTDDLGLEFQYAEVKLEIGNKSSQETNSQVVFVSGKTGVENAETIRVTTRLEPAGSQTSSSPSEIVDLIIRNLEDVRRAAGDDLDVTRLNLTYAIGIKSGVSFDAELKASDLTFGRTQAYEEGAKNEISIYFRR